MVTRLAKFLVKAKTSTYAGGVGEKRLEDGSKELVYKEGDFRYRDRYFGFNPFCGQEIVWQKGEAIWAMNYYGQVISDFEPKKVYNFLRKALKKVKEDYPFRGPAHFRDEKFDYINTDSSGSISEFCGVERIFYDGKEVYIGYFHGGFIKGRVI